MELVPEPRTSCMVKVIVNPRAEECFSMKWTLYPTRKVFVQIITPNAHQLKSIITEMKKELGPSKYAYQVRFNWQNVPQEIRRDGTFKKDIYKLFQNAPALNEFVTPAFFKSQRKPEPEREMLASYIEHVRTHITTFGAHPNFNLRTPKGVKKIHNYVKTVCGKPTITEQESLEIADAIISESNVD